MKILVLMPLDEKNTYMAAGIYKGLTAHAKDICFSMPNFMDYAITTKLSQNWEYALFYSILSAEKVYEISEKENNNLIVIGNMPKKYKFDLIVNFQDLVESLPYEDKFLEMMKKKVEGEEKLVEMVDMYGNEDSNLAMHNVLATADFLSKYIETDPHLEDIEADYQKRLEEWKESLKPTTLH